MPDRARILVVCTGNICRSPYLHQRLNLGLAGTGIEVSSAGTGSLADYPMDELMAAHLGEFADPDFRARQITAEHVLDADLVLTATRNHRTLVTRLAPRALAYTFTAIDFAQLATHVPEADLAAGGALHNSSIPERVAHLRAMRAKVPALPPEQSDIPDPFRQSAHEYAKAAALIDAITPHILRVLR